MTTSTLLDGTTKDYYSCAETAVFVRDALKSAFPGIKFSVVSKTYAGGASMHVKWLDGPTKAEVERVIGPFEGATFDGSIDLKEYVAAEFKGRKVHFGADFIFAERQHSPELQTRAYAYICRKYGMAMMADGDWSRDYRTIGNRDVAQYVGRVLLTMRPNGCVITLK